MNILIKRILYFCILLTALFSLSATVSAKDTPSDEPSATGTGAIAKKTITKIMSKGGLKIEAGSVSGLTHILSNWDTIQNPCPCTIKLLEAMFHGLRDNEGQSFAFVLSDCFKLPQLGGGTFAELQTQGEYLSSELGKNKAQNLRTLRGMINEVRASCKPPSQTSPIPPPPPVTEGGTLPPPPPPPISAGTGTTTSPPTGGMPLPPPVVAPVPAPPKTTPVPQPPPPPLPPVWSVEKPCPQCQEWADLIVKERANLDKVNKELAALQNKLPPLADQQRKLQSQIKGLEAEMARQEGTGGSSFDPETGITIEAITDAKGTVTVTTKDAAGNITEQHTRERRDTSKIKEEIKAKEVEIQKLKDQEAQIKKDVDYNAKLKEKTERAIKTAQEGLEDCVKTKCNPPTEITVTEPGPQTTPVPSPTDGPVPGGGVSTPPNDGQTPGTPPSTGGFTPPPVGGGQTKLECPKPAASEAIQVGANSEVGSGAHAIEKVKETAGSFLGNLLGDKLPFGVGGGGGSSEPEVVKDPVPKEQMETFTAPDGTAIKIGGQMTPEGLLVSTSIVDSPGDGTFQTVFLENSQGQRAGPLGYLVYEMYQDWSLTVSWTHDRYVNGQHVSHEAGGWSKEGTDFLGSFKVPLAGEGIWSQLGFGNAVKGIKSLGTMYPITREQLMASPTSVVIHVTRPKEDPVITAPFIAWIRPMPDGGLKFEQAQKTYAETNCL